MCDALKPTAAGAELKDTATNPQAQHPDPVALGAAAGAAGGAIAALVTCIPTLAIFIVGYGLCAVVGVVTTAILAAVIARSWVRSRPTSFRRCCPDNQQL
ncbi:hypothetical protein ACW2Q0_30855 [Nocardia sp. R16R-3T]